MAVAEIAQAHRVFHVGDAVAEAADDRRSRFQARHVHRRHAVAVAVLLASLAALIGRRATIAPGRARCLPASSAGLSSSSLCVLVGPPLFASGPSRGGMHAHRVACRSCCRWPSGPGLASANPVPLLSPIRLNRTIGGPPVASRVWAILCVEVPRHDRIVDRDWSEITINAASAPQSTPATELPVMVLLVSVAERKAKTPPPPAEEPVAELPEMVLLAAVITERRRSPPPMANPP